MRDVLTSSKRRQRVYHHIILSLSLCDFVIDLATFMSTWPIPTDTSGVWAASGTTQTCTTQGYFLQLAIMAPLYNAALSLYYLLMIKYSWSEERLKRLRIPIHAIILTFGIGTSIAGLPLTLYNPANLWCWIAPLPFGCLESAANGGVTTCERGDNAATVYRWAFFYAPLWTAVAFATVAMILVCWTVWAHETQLLRRWYQRSTSFAVHTSPTALQRREMTRKVTVQALCYVGAFYLTWVWSSMIRIQQSISGETEYALALLTGIFLPSQGFFNFLVYVRPRYHRYREQNPSTRPLSIIGRITSSPDDASADDYNVAPTNEEMNAERRVVLEEVPKRDKLDSGLENGLSSPEDSNKEGLATVVSNDMADSVEGHKRVSFGENGITT